MVALSRRNAAASGGGEKAEFIQGDIFKTDFSKATVITMFLLPDLNLRLRPTLLDMKPGTRVVSNSFDMGEWTPDQEVTPPVNVKAIAGPCCGSYPPRWPAHGRSPGGNLTLTQNFQMVSGTLERRPRRSATAR